MRAFLGCCPLMAFTVAASFMAAIVIVDSFTAPISRATRDPKKIRWLAQQLNLHHPTTSSVWLTSISSDRTAIVSDDDEDEVGTITSAINYGPRPSWRDDGFVFGLDGSGLERPVGRTAMTVVEGDSLETKPYQVAIVSVTILFHAALLVGSFAGMLHDSSGHVSLACMQALLLAGAGWILADLGSGLLHWGVDNYGNGRTPIFGGIIAAFQGHHTAHWTITYRGFFNNVYKLCIPFGIIPMTLINAVSTPAVTFFMTTFCIFEILSQEFHKWSHTTPSEVPPWVNRLQELGLTVGRKQHAQHHLAPFEGNYAIISGVTNGVLDRIGFYRRLEHLVYQWNGVEANSWKLDASLRHRTLQGDYRLVPRTSVQSVINVN